MDGTIRKADLFAGAALAWSVALVTVRRSEASYLRFFFSGVMLSLAILAKGHFAPVYLAAWGTVIVLNAIAMKDKSSTYIWKSYGAALPLVSTLIAWSDYGGLESTIRYYYYGWYHPQKGSEDYMPLGGGLKYFISLFPVGIGVIPGVLLLMWMVAAIWPLNRRQLWDSTENCCDFHRGRRNYVDIYFCQSIWPEFLDATSGLRPSLDFHG